MILAQFWNRFQVSLFPHLEDVLDEPLTEKLKLFVQILDVVRVEEQIAGPHEHRVGRMPADRRSIARAFLAKAVYDLPTTELLIEMLKLQPTLRKLCGFERRRDIPSESTFSRAFAEFAKCSLADQVHVALVDTYVGGDQIVMHMSRDSTAIEAREKAVKKEKPARVAGKRGRPKKGEERPAKEQRRLAKQLTQTATEALAELPKVCDVG